LATVSFEERVYSNMVAVSSVQSSNIPPTPLKKGGYVPVGARGDQVLTEPYWGLFYF